MQILFLQSNKLCNNCLLDFDHFLDHFFIIFHHFLGIDFCIDFYKDFWSIWAPKGELKSSILATCTAQKSTFVYTREWGNASQIGAGMIQRSPKYFRLRFPIFYRKWWQNWSKMMRLRLHLGRFNPILTDSGWIFKLFGDFIGEFINDLIKDVREILASISG